MNEEDNKCIKINCRNDSVFLKLEEEDSKEQLADTVKTLKLSIAAVL